MRTAIMLSCALAALASLPAGAQSARKDSGNNAQLMQQMQQMASERTQLQAENARMKRELDELRKERDTLRASKDSNDRRAQNSEVALARSAQERDQTARELEQLKARTQELVTRFRETIAQLRTMETENTTVRQQLTTRETELKSCVDRNVALYTLNDEILTRFESQGFWSSVAKAEPFTRLKRVELENLADGYRERADDAKVPAPAPAAPGTASAPGG